MGIAANKLNIDIAGATVTVNKEMVAAPERRIGKLVVVINIPMDVSDEHKAKLEHAAHTCPVHKSLHPDIITEIEFNYGG